MSWRFRKTFKVLPGIRLNLTSRGISATVGVAPFSINVGPRGVYSNAGIPGTGIWDRQRLDRPASAPSPVNLPGYAPGAAPLPSFAPPALLGSDVTEIRSASTEMLKSQSMADLQHLLEEAFEERKELERELAAAQREAEYASSRYRKWETGLLFKRIFRDAYVMRKDAHETATAKFQELTEQLRLTVLATQIDIEREQAEPYYRMRDDFAKLCESQKIWDTLDRRDINRVVTRSAAFEAITREPVSFALGCCDIIKWDQKPLHLPNRTGGDLDRRFRDNYQMPIVLYGQLRFTSPTGLNEEFHGFERRGGRTICEVVEHLPY